MHTSTISSWFIPTEDCEGNMGYENCESGWNDLGNQKRGKTEEEKLKGFKLLILDPVNIHGTPKRPESFVAADMIGAGIGETVLRVNLSQINTSL